MHTIAASAADDLIERAKKVLDHNDRETFTVPSEGLYPHQVLWDSCFIAIGRSHYDVERAQSEILRLFSAQWSNGMVPNIIFSEGYHYWWDRRGWRSRISPLAPQGLATSGISQPPMLAEAIVRIGEKLEPRRQHEWYGSVFPHLLSYHQWLYRERQVDDSGLVVQIHPWETGLDNTPPGIAELHDTRWPWWLRLLEYTHLDVIGNYFRFDSRYVPASQRSSNIEALALYALQCNLRRRKYENSKVLNDLAFSIEDVTYNSIFVRANELLSQIAKAIDKKLPEELLNNMRRTARALDNLWDEQTSQYYSRNPAAGQLVREPTIGTFLPLYAGSISADHAKKLVSLMEDKDSFGTNYPLPSVPLNSRWFKPKRYWQGPTWVNTNWLIIDGLKRYGFNEQAEKLIQTTLNLVAENDFFEYFDPTSGKGAGTDNFSWTAALIIDLLNNQPARGYS